MGLLVLTNGKGLLRISLQGPHLSSVFIHQSSCSGQENKMLESHKLHFGRALKLRKQRRRCPRLSLKPPRGGAENEILLILALCHHIRDDPVFLFIALWLELPSPPLLSPTLMLKEPFSIRTRGIKTGSGRLQAEFFITHMIPQGNWGIGLARVN